MFAKCQEISEEKSVIEGIALIVLKYTTKPYKPLSTRTTAHIIRINDNYLVIKYGMWILQPKEWLHDKINDFLSKITGDILNGRTEERNSSVINVSL